MNTPAHLIFGAAAFGQTDSRAVTTASILGALLPDLSLFVMAGWSLFVRHVPSRVVFGQLYFSNEWQSVFAVDNSFLLWGAVFAIANVRRVPWLVAFAGAGILHLIADFLLHHDDARRMFWPLTNWVFVSPVSYWDAKYYGSIVAPLEIVVSLLLCALLWRRFRGRRARLLIVLAALAEAGPATLAALSFRN